jgi:hypothetical protein
MSILVMNFGGISDKDQGLWKKLQANQKQSPPGSALPLTFQ